MTNGNLGHHRSDEEKPRPEDYEQFIRLFAEAERGLRAFIRCLVPAREHVDEIVQETCVVLWRKFSQFEKGTDFLAWSCTVARFEVLKYRRRFARDRHVFNDELLERLADDALVESERRLQEFKALERCIERLPPRQRELIEACYGGGSTIKEVSERLGRSATSLYKTLNRLRASLLECIEGSLAREVAP